MNGRVVIDSKLSIEQQKVMEKKINDIEIVTSDSSPVIDEFEKYSSSLISVRIIPLINVSFLT